jgi:hypothetical protein
MQRIRWEEVHVKWYRAEMAVAESIKSQVLHLGNPARKRATLISVTTNPVIGSCELGFHGYFCCVEKSLKALLEKIEDVSGSFFKNGNSS